MQKALILAAVVLSFAGAGMFKNASLTASRLGPVAIGMTSPAVAAASGERFVPQNGRRFTNSACEYGKLTGLSDVTFMLSRGRVTRIDVLNKTIRTAEGIGIGDTVARVKRVYRSRYKSSPGKYVAKNTEYDVASGKSTHLMVLSDGAHVTALRAGRIPEVYFVEGCS